MRVILKETIEALGIVGSTVSVADGYARNYLLPQDKAVPDTPQNRKMLEQQKAKFELQIAKEREQAEEMAKRLEGVSCTVESQRGRSIVRFGYGSGHYGRPSQTGSAFGKTDDPVEGAHQDNRHIQNTHPCV